MPLVHISYRWSKRPFTNILHIYYDIIRGIRNVIRWVPVIWHDVDWDSDPLLEMIEFKLNLMAPQFDPGNHVLSLRQYKQIKTAALLCKRLRADEYHELNVDRSKPWAYRKAMAERAIGIQKQDQEMLGRLIGKYITHWWD